jgi:signal transduction histidine kinase/ActR/RegA family two-component response regulator
MTQPAAPPHPDRYAQRSATLRFVDGGLETAWQAHRSEEVRWWVRVGLIIALVAFNVNYIQEWRAWPELRETLGWMRLGLGTPFQLMTLGLTWATYFRTRLPSLISASFVLFSLICFLPFYFVWPEDFAQAWAIKWVQLLTFCCFLFGLDFIQGLLVAGTVYGLFLFTVIYFETPKEIASPTHTIFAVVMVSCVAALRQIDSRARRAWALQQQLAEEKARSDTLLLDVLPKLEKAKVDADAANEAKTAFLANMSHEMRTPMIPVLGLTELLLRDTNLLESQRKNLATIHHSGQNLVRLIDDILILTSDRGGTPPADHQPWSPRSLARDMERLFSEEAQARGLQLEVVVENGVAPRIYGDLGRTRKVLVNLIGNATKFSERGRIRVIFTARHARLTVAVEDEGPGVDPNLQSQLFQPFVQSERSMVRRYSGTGVGLAVCKRLVDSLDGQIGFAERRPNGSRFWFEIPHLPVPGELSGEDQTGPVGVQPPPKTVPATHGIPTSQAPGQVGSPEATSTPTSAPPAATPLEPEVETVRRPQILLVEDMPVNQMVARMMLEQAGYEVEIIEDGLDALRRIQEGGGWKVILMDWQLPGMDGVEVTRRVRASGIRTPIIAVTANARPEDEALARSAGMDAFVGKPYRFATLLAAIQRVSPETLAH